MSLQHTFTILNDLSYGFHSHSFSIRHINSNSEVLSNPYGFRFSSIRADEVLSSIHDYLSLRFSGGLCRSFDRYLVVIEKSNTYSRSGNFQAFFLKRFLWAVAAHDFGYAETKVNALEQKIMNGGFQNQSRNEEDLIVEAFIEATEYGIGELKANNEHLACCIEKFDKHIRKAAELANFDTPLNFRQVVEFTDIFFIC